MTYRKLYSVHVLPNGRDFIGDFEVDQIKYRLVFAPKNADVIGSRLILTGEVTIVPPNGQKRVIDNIQARLLATQERIASKPSSSRSFDLPSNMKTNEQNSSMIMTDLIARNNSIGVMYMKLSELSRDTFGIPIDLSCVQLNVRLFVTSEIERDLQWLYSGLIGVTKCEASSEEKTLVYLTEINRILEAYDRIPSL